MFSYSIMLSYFIPSKCFTSYNAVLFQNQNDTKTLKKWMAEVDVFLKEEWPALGDSEALEKQLEQCTVSHDFMLRLIR